MQRKVFKLNKSGTVGVTMSKEMMLSGYIANTPIEWVKQEGGWLLKTSPPVEKVASATSQPPETQQKPI